MCGINKHVHYGNKALEFGCFSGTGSHRAEQDFNLWDGQSTVPREASGIKAVSSAFAFFHKQQVS